MDVWKVPRELGKFAASIGCPKLKVFQLQGSSPWPRPGTLSLGPSSTPRPRYGSRSALLIVPHFSLCSAALWLDAQWNASYGGPTVSALICCTVAPATDDWQLTKLLTPPFVLGMLPTAVVLRCTWHQTEATSAVRQFLGLAAIYE